MFRLLQQALGHVLRLFGCGTQTDVVVAQDTSQPGTLTAKNYTQTAAVEFQDMGTQSDEPDEEMGDVQEETINRHLHARM